MSSETLSLLAIVADTSATTAERLSALEAIQEKLPEQHPYCHTPLWSLMEKVKQPWETRPYLVNGRAVFLQVKRPPESLADIL